MNLPEIILWMLAFAVVTAIIYGWGLAKSRDRQRDLLAVLYGKGETLIKRLLKKNGSMSPAELEKALSGTRASLFYSRGQQAVVNDPKVFTAELLRLMTEKNVIVEDGPNYRLK